MHSAVIKKMYRAAARFLERIIRVPFRIRPLRHSVRVLFIRSGLSNPAEWDVIALAMRELQYRHAQLSMLSVNGEEHDFEEKLASERDRSDISHLIIVTLSALPAARVSEFLADAPSHILHIDMQGSWDTLKTHPIDMDPAHKTIDTPLPTVRSILEHIRALHPTSTRIIIPYSTTAARSCPDVLEPLFREQIYQDMRWCNFELVYVAVQDECLDVLGPAIPGDIVLTLPSACVDSFFRKISHLCEKHGLLLCTHQGGTLGDGAALSYGNAPQEQVIALCNMIASVYTKTPYDEISNIKLAPAQIVHNNALFDAARDDECIEVLKKYRS